MKYILRVKAWISVLSISFCQISNLSFYLNKNELRKIVKKITKKKVQRLIYAFWCLPKYATYANILAHDNDQVRPFQGNCRILNGRHTMYCFDFHNPNHSREHKQTWKVTRITWQQFHYNLIAKKSVTHHKGQG